jgi:uncharacterized protein YjbI with pentapeptide repeats
MNRCVLVSSSMGQANAARDKLYDLRECDLRSQSAAGKDMSGMIASEADFSGVSFKEAQISKYVGCTLTHFRCAHSWHLTHVMVYFCGAVARNRAFARNSKFVEADFSNAIVDR